MNGVPQKPRVLRALERAGRRGITQVDFLGPVTIDGGPPILRLPARINELRRVDGLRIDVRGRAQRCARYVLIREPAAPAPPVTASADAALFEAPPPTPRCAIDPEGEL